MKKIAFLSFAAALGGILFGYDTAVISGTIYFFAAMCVPCLLIMWRLVPETTGKSLEDHDDVIARACGVDAVMQLADRGMVTGKDIKDLHRRVVTREVLDIYKPIGDWKREDNGTYNSENGRPVYMA